MRLVLHCLNVFLFANGKTKKRNENEKTKNKTIGGGYKWERNTNTSSLDFSFCKLPFIENRLWGVRTKNILFRGTKKGQKGTKSEKKYVVKCRLQKIRAKK